MTRPARAVRARPAETSGGLGALATGIAALTGASTTTVAIVGAAAGLLPAAVTLLVTNGGVRGIVRTVWSGRRSTR